MQPIASQLSHVIRAGLPLESGLRALAEQTRSRGTRHGLISLCEQLERGVPLEEALRETRTMLPPAMNVLIEAGLESGQLNSVMQYCIEQPRRAASLRQQVWLALSYPFFLTWFSLLICCCILLGLVPTFSDVIGSVSRDFQVELPSATRGLLAVVDYLQSLNGWPWLIPIVFGVVTGLFFLLAGFTNWGHRRSTSVPLIGKAFQYAALVDLCQILAILAESGLPITRALVFAGKASDDRWLARRCQIVSDEIEKGSTPSAAAQLARFPNSLVQAFRETRTTTVFSESLRGLAEVFAALSENSVSVVSQLIGPIAVLFVVVLAGSTMILLMWPLIRLIQVF